MGTLLLTLNKWEIVSGDLGGHYISAIATILLYLVDTLGNFISFVETDSLEKDRADDNNRNIKNLVQTDE